jgi:thiamine biosynthesis lipoprotein
MLHQLTELGYDAPWQQRVPATTQCESTHGQPQPASTEPIDLFPVINGVRIPEATGFDPGGIGKGFAADLVTDFLIAGGATCTSVELGGDVRVSGEPWFDVNWSIGVADPFDESADIAAFSPEGGAVATSSILRRSWVVDGVQRHHLLDPGTGRPAATDLVSATACSSEAWWAEIASKVALIAGSNEAIDLLQEFGAPGLIVAADGSVKTTATEARVERAEDLVRT